MKMRSIRFRMTFWFTAALCLMAALIFFALRTAVRLNLRSTVRGYLIGMVEENVNKISYSGNCANAGESTCIPLGKGALLVDEDFMEAVNNVLAGLYLADGRMLYGENPVARQTAGTAFTQTKVWQLPVGKTRYLLYDRKLNLDLPDGETLWIRGVVSEAEIDERLSDMTRLVLLFLPFLLIAAILSGWLLTDRMLSPIRKMEHTASNITEGGDLGKRLPSEGGKDELSRLAEVFNLMLGRLETSFAQERQFTSDASHELRTPLSVILAECEATLAKPRKAEEYVDSLRVVLKQGRRMSALVSDLLDFTRMEQGSARYQMDSVDLSALATEAADGARTLLEGGMTLETKIEPGLFVHGNRNLLARLVTNLLDNARRYGRAGGEISLSLARGIFPGSGEDGVVLTVRDDGIGISLEDQEKIFDRFWRSDASRSIPGTGLGLSMVKSVADLHGARVELDSEPGKGSVFKVFFSDVKKTKNHPL
ncbi:MAG: HAMP domain-containing histidine kinase [Oscillospiraceae bacterium]|nr:HAMP domain-containing histidine kinase [Oscillospiraceae bacterium]MBR4895420.1 HAMP domain-containing histidine kinase [Clostridia bacterium]